MPRVRIHKRGMVVCLFCACARRSMNDAHGSMNDAQGSMKCK